MSLANRCPLPDTRCNGNGQSVDAEVLYDVSFVAMLAAAALLAGVVSGAYPAVVLSRIETATVVKQGARGHAGMERLRKALTTFQFAVSIALIAGTLVVQAQLRYVLDAPLGYAPEQVVSLQIPGALEAMMQGITPAPERAEAVKREFLNTAGVRSVSLAHGPPTYGIGSTVENDGDRFRVSGNAVDEDYLETMGMTLVAGRGFSGGSTGDVASGIVVNETAARLIRLEDRLGERLDVGLFHPEPTLLGIVRDFHTGSLHHAIGPVMLFVRPALYTTHLVRIDTDRLAETLASLRATWERLVPDYPFEPLFVDDVVQAQYAAENRLRRALGSFSALSILLACLGLVGVTAHTLERRTKEIGIRTVFGATAGRIFPMLYADLGRLVAIASIVAVPVAYLVVSRWLEDFAYRIDVDPPVFLAAILTTLALAGLAVGYQATRAARANPIDSRRHE